MGGLGTPPKGPMGSKRAPGGTLPLFYIVNTHIISSIDLRYYLGNGSGPPKRPDGSFKISPLLPNMG